MYSFNFGGDCENKARRLSKSYSKEFQFQEYKNCLDGREYQRECNTYIFRSINHEMYLQILQESTLSIFERIYLNKKEC